MKQKSPLNILVVEDEILVATDIEETLLSLDYKVQNCVASGNAAISEVEKNLPDLILMDIMLKGEMTGIEAARLITQKHDVPVIYLTANADIATIEKAKISLPYGYIIKPFTERDLQTNIEIARFKFENDMKAKLESDQFRKFFKQDGNSEPLFVEGDKNLEKLSPDDIYYIEQKEDNTTLVHLIDEEIVSGYSLDQLETQFEKLNFVRISKDVMVNAGKIFLKRFPEIILADTMTVLIADEEKQPLIDSKTTEK